MARARSIKPGFFKNEELSEQNFQTRLLFAGLWTLADREGRLEYRPKRIKAEIFPYDNVNLERLLKSLAEAKFITIYESAGNHYISVPTWKKHQNPHIKEPASTIPAPCENSACTGNSGTSPADSLNPVTGTLNPVTSNASTGQAPDSQDLCRSALYDRYHEFVALWPNPIHVDHGAQVWMQLVDSGDITEASLGKVFSGLERWKKSRLWKKGYKHGIAKWLLQKHWMDDPEQVGEEAW